MLGCAVTRDLQAQGTQRSTRSASASETNSLEIFKSLDRLDAKEDGSKRLDDELARTLQSFTSQRSLDSAMPSSYQMPRMPAVKSRRSKDGSDQSRGWVWNAEEVISGRSDKDASLFPGFSSGSAADKRKASWDQFSDQTSSDQSASSGSRSANKSNARRDSSSDDEEASLPRGIREAAKTLKANLEKDSVGSIFNPTSAHTSALDIFGSSASDNVQTPDQIQAHKAYMEEYLSIIGRGTSMDPLVNKQDKRTLGPGQIGQSGGLDSLPGSSHRDTFTSASGMTPSVLKQGSLPDVNATVLNQWNPLYTAPQPELPKPMPFFTPPLEVPRRKF